MKISELEEKVDLYSLIAESNNITRVGRNHRVNPCPVCGHRDHFTVFPETNSYSSFSHCCKGGSVYRYLQEVIGLDENSAFEKLCELAKEEVYKPTPVSNHSVITVAENETDFTNFIMSCYEESEKNFRIDIVENFYKRGITINEIMNHKLCIYQADDGKRAMFPIWSNGKVVYYEARALEGQEPKYKKPFGVSNTFFNVDYLDEPPIKPIFVTEGIMDALSLEHLGYKAISINGTQFVSRFVETIRQNPNTNNTIFITAFDNDAAGNEAAQKLPFKKLVIPEPYKDINEWLIGSYESQDGDVLSIKESLDKQLETVSELDTVKVLFQQSEVDESNLIVMENEATVLPKNYVSKNGSLHRVTEKVVNGEIKEFEVFICRQTPIITRSFMNVEYPQLYHELTWSDKGRIYKEVVPAGDLAIKKELLKLSYKSLAVTDNNAKHLIEYFDKLNMVNKSDHDYLVERLGHIKNTFIHPLFENNVKILPPDIGEIQLLEAFQTSGTSEEWIANVFKPIMKHPKALVMVLASFTSVIIKDLKITPFIVDLSGSTSQGKTTVLRVCASVWGNENLLSEWNLTKVSAERKSAFLNSFPLILDDTRKAEEKQLKSFVYNFSGGRSKGRGSVSGSQREFTWNNILLSTGEDSLNEYADRAGGVAARIIPLTGLPFESVNYQFFSNLYSSIDKYYGSIGLDFIKRWQSEKEDLMPQFYEFNEVFQKKSQGNEVIGRVARYYAAVVFTGKLLNEFFDAGIDLKALNQYFDVLMAENKSVDKPMQLLESILSDLDADRSSIFYDFAPQREIKAIYNKGTLYLLLKFLKESLKTEEKTIRSEWLRRGISIADENNGRKVDYKKIKHKGQSFRGVVIQPEIIKELGFDFELNSNSNSSFFKVTG